MQADNHRKPAKFPVLLLACVTAVVFAVSASSQEPVSKRPFRVKIEDEKPVVLEALGGGIDPQQHIQVQSQGNMYLNLQSGNQRLGFVQTNFHVDGNVLFPGNPPGRMISNNQPLPPGKGKKPRIGSLSAYEIGKLVITQEVEVVPSKAKAGEKRRLDAAMVRYFIENKDTQPHKIGVRALTYSFLGGGRTSNAFVAPTQPNKILDGVELKGKEVPNHLQILQNADLKNPGQVAHLTCNLGRTFLTPDRIVLTGQNALINQWDIQPVKAMRLSLMGIFWDPQEIKAGSKRALAVAFGEGIALGPEGEGQFAVTLGGSFEPGKLFTVVAYVQDPAPGQTLTLELPPGMGRVEGKERQPMPEVNDEGICLVLWKARVLRTGRFPVHIRSSTGTTQTKIITITPPGEEGRGT